MKGFKYENTETVLQKGGKIVRNVTIKKGRGYKSITKYHNGKKISSVKKPIHKSDIELIKKGVFIPGLFQECKNCKTKKRKAGGGYDIEMGPEQKDIKLYPVPPDPERFKKYDEQFRSRPASPEEAVSLFSGPTPEARQAMERRKMGLEDPRDINPFEQEVKIFSKGGKTRKIISF
jgi:hypothetical protein